MRTFTFSRVVAGLIAITALASQIDAATATIDVNNWHQKIRGFGLSTAWSGRMTPTEADQLWDTIKGAGFSMNRVMIDRDGLGNEETDNAISATNRGALVWGTPWYTKGGVGLTYYQPNNRGGTDTIRYDTLYEKDYQEWANTLATMANTMKAKGAPIYAISSGNEIDIGWTKYSPEALALWVGKYLGPTMAQKAPGTKIIGMEPCNWWGFDNYLGVFKTNPDAWKYSDIIATHEYGGTVHAAPEINAAGKEFWETEIYDPVTDQGEDVGMGSALRVSKIIHEALTVANMNAWHYWWKNPCTNCANGAIWAESTHQPTKRLWIMGNWSRYARPGFIRVEAPVEPSSGVYLTAFRDTALSKVVLVIANSNNNSVSQSFSIPGITPRKVTPVITDPTRDLVIQASQDISSSDFTYNLPSQSVTTLVFDMSAPVPAHRDTVFNGGFDQGVKGWTFNTWGSTAQGSVVNGEYKIDISALGTGNASIQLVQNGIVLQQGKSYEVKFDAYASANRTLEGNVELDVSPWTSYLPALKSFDLTTTKTTYSYIFTMANATDSNGRISFNAGASTTGLFLDNISIKEVPTPVALRGIAAQSGFAAVVHDGSRLDVALGLVQSKRLSITVTDLLGKQIRTAELRNDKHRQLSWTSDVSNLPAGIYLVRVEANGGTVYSSKFYLGK